jgi:hypothetical protein
VDEWSAAFKDLFALGEWQGDDNNIDSYSAVTLSLFALPLQQHRITYQLLHIPCCRFLSDPRQVFLCSIAVLCRLGLLPVRFRLSAAVLGARWARPCEYEGTAFSTLFSLDMIYIPLRLDIPRHFTARKYKLASFRMVS